MFVLASIGMMSQEDIAVQLRHRPVESWVVLGERQGDARIPQGLCVFGLQLRIGDHSVDFGCRHDLRQAVTTEFR